MKIYLVTEANTGTSEITKSYICYAESPKEAIAIRPKGITYGKGNSWLTPMCLGFNPDITKSQLIKCSKI
jgi:hypothetical protein